MNRQRIFKPYPLLLYFFYLLLHLEIENHRVFHSKSRSNIVYGFSVFKAHKIIPYIMEIVRISKCFSLIVKIIGYTQNRPEITTWPKSLLYVKYKWSVSALWYTKTCPFRGASTPFAWLDGSFSYPVDSNKYRTFVCFCQ